MPSTRPKRRANRARRTSTRQLLISNRIRDVEFPYFSTNASNQCEPALTSAGSLLLFGHARIFYHQAEKLTNPGFKRVYNPENAGRAQEPIRISGREVTNEHEWSSHHGGIADRRNAGHRDSDWNFPIAWRSGRSSVCRRT